MPGSPTTHTITGPQLEKLYDEWRSKISTLTIVKSGDNDDSAAAVYESIKKRNTFGEPVLSWVAFVWINKPICSLATRDGPINGRREEGCGGSTDIGILLDIFYI